VTTDKMGRSWIAAAEITAVTEKTPEALPRTHGRIRTLITRGLPRPLHPEQKVKCKALTDAVKESDLAGEPITAADAAPVIKVGGGLKVVAESGGVAAPAIRTENIYKIYRRALRAGHIASHLRRSGGDVNARWIRVA